MIFQAVIPLAAKAAGFLGVFYEYRLFSFELSV